MDIVSHKGGEMQSEQMFCRRVLRVHSEAGQLTTAVAVIARFATRSAGSGPPLVGLLVMTVAVAPTLTRWWNHPVDEAAALVGH